MARPNPFEKFLSKEQKEHAAVVRWLNYQLPWALWVHYPGEGKRTPFERYLWTIMGAKKNIPDFLFFDHRGKFCGLALELKHSENDIYNKDGSLRADKREQGEMLEEFKKRKWRVSFAQGTDQAIEIIKSYYKL